MATAAPQTRRRRTSWAPEPCLQPANASTVFTSEGAAIGFWGAIGAAVTDAEPTTAPGMRLVVALPGIRVALIGRPLVAVVTTHDCFEDTASIPHASAFCAEVAVVARDAVTEVFRTAQPIKTGARSAIEVANLSVVHWVMMTSRPKPPSAIVSGAHAVVIAIYAFTRVLPALHKFVATPDLRCRAQRADT